MTGTLLPQAAPFGWLAVVRSDRTVPVDGPAAEAPRIVREALELLGASNLARAAVASVWFDLRGARRTQRTTT